ncbi:MAG: PilN domain-containing protein [Patescibacteria group bacterium]
MKILLNLLPEEKKMAIERGLHARILLWQFFSLFLLELFFLGILFTIIVLLKVDLNGAKLSSESAIQAIKNDEQDLKKYEDKFLGINEAIGTVGRIEASHLHFTQLFRILDTVQPKEVFLRQMTTKDRKVMLSGIASTREDLLLFEEQLKSSACVEKVDVPLSNLFSQKNLEFQIEFTITLECLRKNNL